MIFIVCFDNFDLNLKMKMLIVQSKEYMFHAAGKRLFRNGKTRRRTFFSERELSFSEAQLATSFVAQQS